MLKALYDYGIRNHLAVPPGFLRKNIRAYICLSESGKFLGIEQCGKEEQQICPDIGSLANGPGKCNPLAEKASVVLGESGKKPAYFRSLLKDASAHVGCLRVCLAALEDETVLEQIRLEAKLRKLKDSDRISKEKRGLDRIYEDKLNAVCAFFGSAPERQLPATLNLEGQSYFALGYHQMCTQITGEIKKRIAEKQEG